MAGVCTHMQLEATSFKPPYLVLTYTCIFLYLLAPHTNFGTDNHSLKYVLIMCTSNSYPSNVLVIILCLTNEFIEVNERPCRYSQLIKSHIRYYKSCESLYQCYKSCPLCLNMQLN